MQHKSHRSLPELFGDVANDLVVLVTKETHLARAEMTEKIGDLAIGIGLLVGGAVLLIPALVILLEAAVAGLITAGIASAWASLIVGGAALLVGLILLGIGISRLKSAQPIPARTISQLERDVEVAKSQMRNDNGASKHAA